MDYRELVLQEGSSSRCPYINAGIPTVFFSSSPKMCGNEEAQLVAPVLPLVVAKGRCRHYTP
jgi:hypothetical protein